MSEDIANKFKSELIFFFDELIQLFPKEPSFIVIRIMLKDQVNIFKLINKLTKKLLPQKEEVKKRNDDFFISYGFNLFGDTNKEMVQKYANLWNSLDNDDKTTIWRWYDSFIYLGELYTNKLKEE